MTKGNLDVSPKGDPAGLRDRARRHDRRAARNARATGARTSFHNILRNPHVGLIALIPGRDDTLRINGRATIVRDAPFMAGMEVKGHLPSARPRGRDRGGVLPLLEGVPVVEGVGILETWTSGCGSPPGTDLAGGRAARAP